MTAAHQALKGLTFHTACPGSGRDITATFRQGSLQIVGGEMSNYFFLGILVWKLVDTDREFRPCPI